MKQGIYIDTSVVGGYFDDEFSQDTIPLFERAKSGDIIIIISDLLEAELLRAPEFVKELLPSIPQNNIKRVKLSQEAAELADKYIEAKVVGENKPSRLSAYCYCHTLQCRYIGELEF